MSTSELLMVHRIAIDLFKIASFGYFWRVLLAQLGSIRKKLVILFNSLKEIIYCKEQKK